MSLVEVTKDTRIFLKVAAVVGVLGVIGFFLFKGGQFVKNVYFPDPPAPAEAKFGILPSIGFPLENNEGFEYRIETVTGFLPTFPTTLPIYKLKKSEPTITALPDAKVKAAAIGYTDGEQALSTSEYKWNNPSLDTSLFYEIYNLNFSVTTTFANSASFLPMGGFSKSDLMSVATAFISSLGGNIDDINTEKTTVSYYIPSSSGMVPTTDTDTAPLARLELFQKNVNDLPIYYPSETGSTLYFTLALLERDPNVVEASYHHFTPNLSEGSTYYIKTAQEAYDELMSGKGYIVKPTENKSIGITEVLLGYYLNNTDTQEYLLPIVVFKGLDNFEAYVPAVRN